MLAVPIFSDALSSSISSMIMAKITGDDIASAAAMGAATGALFSVTNAIGLLNYIDRDPEGFAREFYGDDVVLMNETQSVAFGKEHPGTVMGAFANGQEGFTSKFIANISGGGPLSHVRGSDFKGNVVESNANKYENGSPVGIVDYYDPTYKGDVKLKGTPSLATKNRLTLVSTRFTSGVNGTTVRSLRGTTYGGGLLCVGATQLINNAYVGGAPNFLMPYAIRKSYAVNVW